MVSDTHSEDWTAALDAGCARALSASHYLQRALVAEGVVLALPADRDPAAEQGTGGPARSWLCDLARAPWTGERILEQYRRNLAGLAASAAPPSASNTAQNDPSRASESEVARALCRTRRQLLCGLMVRDCAGLASLEEVTGAMTAFAELAVRTLLAAIAPDLAARHGTPVDAAGKAQDLLVLAMGKGGAAELNVSSDLDLVFVYGEVAACRTAREDAPAAASSAELARSAPMDGQEFFDRLGRRLIGALGEHGADGFVFRVDLRLRPHGDSGPLAVSIAMLEEYLVREGREWERFAWAKARVISAPVLAQTEDFADRVAGLDAVVQPFVYRKYFDFGAIGAIRELQQRIGAESRRRSMGRADRVLDVKLGRGGIREIEFLAQTFCIMRGGRDHRLRARGTVATLQTLGQLGLLAAAQAGRLIDDYRFLRRLEHALQYRDDAQTHSIPTRDADRQRVARLLNMASGEEMLERYRIVSEDVARSFDAMFPSDLPGAGDSLANGKLAIDADALAQSGFADANTSAARLQQLLSSPRLAAMSAAARNTIGKLAGQAVRLIGTITRETQPEGGASGDEILLRWIRLVEVIGRRSTYFSLLAEYPLALERVLRLLATGGWATEYLLRHPIVLDELVDPRSQQFWDERVAEDADAMPGAAEPLWLPWIAQVDAQLQVASADVERQMNVLRDAHHAQVFRLLLADLGGHLRLEHLADHLSALADAVLTLALRAVGRSIELARVAAGQSLPRLAVIAYGKLGGRELGYASDLDLIFVYEAGAGAQAAEHDATVCTLLVRRLIAWLTAVTSSGILFEIDLRLRPNGNAGLLVTPIEAFERYQANVDGHGAWPWEHQALTRARFCAGDAAVGARVEQIRAQVLRQPREPKALAAEVLAMRLRMLEGHLNRSEHFDIKHDRGGMVDIEFIVQYLVLAHAHRHAALLANRGNIGLLSIAADLGLIESAQARTCAAAYRRYRQLQHALRLNGAERARVDRARVQAEIDAVLLLWQGVFGTDQPLPPKTPGGGARTPGLLRAGQDGSLAGGQGGTR
ncbi:Glutamate-ammonia-ligase adenylyltransferase [Burkholderiales bacterium]|nr:Glutamate-ammonia-ligase adenylyltransferase [Burkholderiales bacterium]